MKRQKNQHKINRRRLLKTSGVILPSILFGLHSCGSAADSAMDADVIIVGAGLSGLNAALLLEESGFKVKVVEATDRLGGRVHTVKDSLVPGHPEIGANGIGGGYARILNAAQKYNVEIGPSRPRTEPREGEILYAIKNELISKANWADHKHNPYPEGHRSGSPTSPPWSIYSKQNPLPKNDLTAWKQSAYAAHDKSVYELLQKEGFSDEAINMGVSTNSSYGVDAKRISALMYFQIMNFIISQSSSFSGKGGAAVGGNQRIPEAMGAAFQQDILLKSPVKSISSEKDYAKVTLQSDKVLKAPYVICTLPNSALRKISLSPSPTGAQQKAIQNLSYTPCVQIHYAVNKKYWEEDGMAPSMWTDTKGGRFMALKNDLTDPDRVTSCLAYLNSTVALEIDKMGEAAGTKLVTQTLEKLRPSLKGAIEPIYYWTWCDSNPYAGGAYAFWQPGQITEFANDVAQPNGRIHFAGEHTADLNRGMEGAMESGERAAFDIMNLLG